MPKGSLAFSKWMKAEKSARHSLFVFLLIFTLVELDITARKSRQAEEQASRTWITWGVTFVLLAFFIISPEKELVESRVSRS